MQTIAKAATRVRDMGSPLPAVYPTLGVQFRRGATSMIAGPPGSFKSTLALNMVAEWAKGEAELYALYFSLDSDEFTVAKRLAACVSGDTMAEVERYLARGKYADELSRFGDTRFVFRSVDMQGIDRHVRSFEQVYGCFPDLIVLDNLLNAADYSGENEYSAMKQMTRDLDVLAREARSHVMILHHTNESEFSDTDRPPPRRAITGKLSQMPRLILTINASPGGSLMVAVVKNTLGPQDPSGRVYTSLLVDGERCQVREIEQRQRWEI